MDFVIAEQIGFFAGFSVLSVCSTVLEQVFA
jgi:hypothetical protein